MLVTGVIFGCGVYGTTQIETDFNPIWYMRKSSYQSHFYSEMTEYFPENGERVQVYVGNIQYWDHIPEMLAIEEGIAQSSHLREGSIRYWFRDFYYSKCVNNGGNGTSLGDNFTSDEEDFWNDWDDGDGPQLEVGNKDCTDGE